MSAQCGREGRGRYKLVAWHDMGAVCPMMAINFLTSHIFNFIEKGVLSCLNGGHRSLV